MPVCSVLPRFLICLVVAFTFGLLATFASAAEGGDKAGELAFSVQSPERQAKLYEKLKAEADYFERQAAVLKTVAQLLGPTVVHIEADVNDRSAFHNGARSGPVEEAGSGVIISLGGQYYVLTNRHIFCDAPPEMIRVQLADRRWIRPQKIWTDPGTDVAVFSIEAAGLVAARTGDSDKVQVGDFALAIGSPFGLSRSVTFGIVSAKNRRDLELGNADVKYQNFLQTDAAINPGNSGGPLVNLHGEVIGINTAIASSSGGNEGIGFAIPINMALNVVHQLIDQGRVQRAFLGVTIDSKFGPAVAAELGLSRAVGARVTAITEGSPAEMAGLKINDVILRFRNIPIEDDAHLVNLIGLSGIHDKVTITVFRDREVQEVEADLRAYEDFKKPAVEKLVQ
jgi:serine protease Do